MTELNKELILSEANDELLRLLDIHDNEFGDKNVKKLKMSSIVALIEGKLDQLISNNDNNTGLSSDIEAKVLYIRGRSLDCIDGTLAEALLSKSVKLDPTNYEAWIALGICLWKKDNKNDAKSCLLESIKQKPNKEALCELSILTRQIISKDQKLSTSIDESINLAKQAIQLDLSYHKSWYVLGNANCTRFFSVTQDIADLNKAFAAYKRAEILVNGDKNPDLYFTKGNVSRYLQHYDVALKSYHRARELDESLAQVTDGPISEIIAFQNRLYETFSEKADASVISKSKREIAAAPFTKGAVTIDKLQAGLNKKALFAGLVIRLIPNGSDNMPPSTYLCMDAAGTACAVSLYNMGQDGNNLTNKIITIMDPLVIDTNLYKDNAKIIAIEQNQSVFKSSNTKTFKLLQVFYIQQLQINGEAIKNEQFAPTKLKLSTFDI